MIKIVVDLMGADKPANELVSGAIDAINENSDLMVTLCAKKDIIMPVLDTLSYNKEQVEIIDCSEEIRNDKQFVTELTCLLLEKIFIKFMVPP